MVTNLLESYCHQMPKTTPRQLVHLSGLMTSTSPTVLPASPSTLQNATDAVFPSSVTISPNYNFFHSLDTGSTSRFRVLGGSKQVEIYLESDASNKRWDILQNHTGKDLGGDCGASRVNKLTSIFWRLIDHL